MRKNFFLLIVPLLLGACSQEADIELANSTKTSTTRISLEQAKANAIDFAMRSKRHTRSNAAVVSVGNAYPVTAGMNTTRATSNGVSVGDTLFYVINFANNEGFVVAGADTRGEEVYVYVPQGNYVRNARMVRSNLEIGNTGFDEYMRRLETAILEIDPTDNDIPIKKRQEDDWTKPKQGAYKPLPDFYKEIGPLLSSEWGQSYPYNKYCPKYCPTGCAITALAQACLFVQQPKSFDGIDLDWAAIDKACKKGGFALSNSEELDRVAKFMRYLGIQLNANYSPTGTGAKSKDAVAYLHRIGVRASNLNTYRAHGMDDELLKGGRIVWMEGCDTRIDRSWLVGDKYEGGHAWLADGAVTLRKNGKESEYIHINWGWSSRRDGVGYRDYNGYYSPWVLDSRKEDNQKPTRSNQKGLYQYKIRTSTISKPNL